MITRIKLLFVSLFFSPRFYLLLALTCLLWVLSFFFTWIELFAQISLGAVIVLPLFDCILLYKVDGVRAMRDVPERLSNGDKNPICIEVSNFYAFQVSLHIVDEIPFQFQQRDVDFTANLASNASTTIEYQLRPTERGEYSFGSLNVFASSPLGLAQRKFVFEGAGVVPVYPSFMQMRKYELLAISNRLMDVGVKRIRKIGQAREFDQIREYIPGDEFRHINWNATARKSQLMVNQYQDEKSQHVYSIIDMGRTMKMPFEQLSLLDYSINAALVISNIAMLKDDKAGVVTFSESIGGVIKAERSKGHIKKILEMLYNQRTSYKEANYELLYATIKRTIHQRSLLILYTNFESLSSMKRQMKFFSMLAKSHLLCVVFFENTELRELLDSSPNTLEDVYIKTIAERFAHEKKLILSELERHGIQAIFTAPQNLTINTINKYLEIKARGLI